MPIYIGDKKVGIATVQVSTEDKYVFDTVAIMKSSSKAFVEGDTIKVNGYYIKGDLVDSTLRYKVMSYENWWNSLPEDMKVVSYTAGWFGYKYIKTQVDEYGNHTLSNGLVAKLITDGTVYAEQFGCKGDGVTNDITAIRHLFGMNKKNITIKFQKGKTYIVGTEEYNRMYYDDDLFNLVKDNNLYTSNKVCVCNEYATQGGKAVGEYCCHIKPTLTNAENVILDGNNCTIFIPNNEFNSVDTETTPFSWLEMSNYINGLEIKNFTIDCNGLNQKVKADGTPMTNTNHGIFYGGGNAAEISSNSTMAGYLTAAGVSSNVFDAFPRRFTNVSIHDNKIYRTGVNRAIGDMGGDGILIIPPPTLSDFHVYNNTFVDMGRWSFAIDLVNDLADCTNVKFHDNNTSQTNDNYVVVNNSDGTTTNKYRGLGWIDFECTRRFVNLEVKNNTVNGLGGFAFNGSPNAKGENIQICNNYINVPSISYFSAYPYDLNLYNLNANNVLIEGNTIINNLANDNTRSLGYAINNITIRNNKTYKCLMMHNRCTGAIIIEGNSRIDANGNEISTDTQVMEFTNHTEYENYDTIAAEIVFINNKGGFTGFGGAIVSFPPNYSFLIYGNTQAFFNLSFLNSNRPRIDLEYVSQSGYYKSLRGASIYKPCILTNLTSYLSYGCMVEVGDILAKNDTQAIVVTKAGYLPITKGSFKQAHNDITGNSASIGETSVMFYNGTNVYKPLNTGTLGGVEVTHTSGVVTSGEVDLEYFAPQATYEIITL